MAISLERRVERLEAQTDTDDGLSTEELRERVMAWLTSVGVFDGRINEERPEFRAEIIRILTDFGLMTPQLDT
jgi:hypothetical protein